MDDPLLIEPPDHGRIHSHRRRVHLADGTPKGRIRLDAVARMLQDISDEDTTDAGFPPDEPWVVRRVQLRVQAFPAFRDHVAVSTWCSGIGGRWAERRVRIDTDAARDGDGGDVGIDRRIDAAVLWVHLDTSGRPARLPDRFDDLYADAARGRKVRARLHHEGLPTSLDGLERRRFPLRFRDFDVMGHVNNAVSWEPVEDALAERPALRAPMRVSMEHPGPIDPGDQPEIVVRDLGEDRTAGFDLWIVVDGVVRSSAQVRRAD